MLPEKNCKINLRYSYLEDQNNLQPNAISHSSLKHSNWGQNLEAEFRDDLIAGFSFIVRCSKLP